MVAAEKIKFVLVADSLCTRTRKRNLALARKESPFVDVDVVDKKVILSVLVVCASEKVYFVFYLDAVVSSPWRKVTLPVRQNLSPLAYLHIHEVLAREARLRVALP